MHSQLNTPSPSFRFDPATMENGYDVPNSRVIQSTVDEHGMRISHVRLRNGEYAQLNSFDLSRLTAMGMHVGDWYVAKGPSGHLAVAAPSRNPRLPVVLVARVILGCTPGEFVRFGRRSDPLSHLDMRRSNIALETRSTQAFSLVTLRSLEGASN